MLLQTEHITHNFGGLCAISDFNIEIRPGELMGLIGPNGAGKTTVFNLMTGVYRPTQGNIRFENQTLTGMMPQKIAALGIARTFQNIRLFKSLTVLDHIRIAQDMHSACGFLPSLIRTASCRRSEDESIDRALSLLILFQLEPYAGHSAVNLSYGLQRRLELARALAMRPKLLLLDEPAAGLNPHEIQQLMDLIRWVRTTFQVTILLIEHQMHLVMNLCERIVVLDFGVTIAAGTPHEIQRHPKVLEAYLGQKPSETETPGSGMALCPKSAATQDQKKEDSPPPATCA